LVTDFSEKRVATRRTSGNHISVVRPADPWKSQDAVAIVCTGRHTIFCLQSCGWL